MSRPRVAVLLLNYDQSGDTIACLKSLLKLDYPTFQIVVGDNSPTNEPIATIKDWAQREPSLKGSLKQCSEDEIEALGDQKLTLIQLRANNGYAAGNNVGLKFILRNPAGEFVWLLNPDTTVDPGALSALVDQAEANPRAGLIGSLVCYHDRPTIVQAAGGGVYNRWFGLSRHLADGQNAAASFDHDLVGQQLDYIYGTSMLITRQFLETVGFLSPEYFLYHEEIDLALRAHHRFQLDWAPNSRVYHRHGRSVSPNSDQKSRVADYYEARGRILLTAKFFPFYLPTVYLGLVGSFVKRVRRGQFDRAGLIIRAMLRPRSRLSPAPVSQSVA